MNKPRNFSLKEAKDLFQRLHTSISEDDREEFYDFVMEAINGNSHNHDDEEEDHHHDSEKKNEKDEALQFVIQGKRILRLILL